MKEQVSIKKMRVNRVKMD